MFTWQSSHCVWATGAAVWRGNKARHCCPLPRFAACWTHPRHQCRESRSNNQTVSYAKLLELITKWLPITQKHWIKLWYLCFVFFKWHRKGYSSSLLISSSRWENSIMSSSLCSSNTFSWMSRASFLMYVNCCRWIVLKMKIHKPFTETCSHKRLELCNISI